MRFSIATDSVILLELHQNACWGIYATYSVFIVREKRP